jgi:hypothetical protein
MIALRPMFHALFSFGAVGRAAGTPSLEDGKPKGSREGEAGKQEGVPVVTKSLGGKNLKRLLAIWTLYISAGMPCHVPRNLHPLRVRTGSLCMGVVILI